MQSTATPDTVLPANLSSGKNARRSALARSKLIFATTDALNRLGYAATTTTLVAQLAGVSRGSMLYHYPNKVALMVACIEAGFEYEIAYYRQKLSQVSDPIMRIDALIDAAWTCFKDARGVARTEIWLATRSDRELAAAILPVHADHSNIAEQALARLLKSAGLDDPDFTSTFLTFAVGSMRGLAMSTALGAPAQEVEKSIGFIKSEYHRIIRNGAEP